MSGSANVGFICAALLICVLRGPHETRWIGWRGGWNMNNNKRVDATEMTKCDALEVQVEPTVRSKIDEE